MSFMLQLQTEPCFASCTFNIMCTGLTISRVTIAIKGIKVGMFAIKLASKFLPTCVCMGVWVFVCVCVCVCVCVFPS